MSVSLEWGHRYFEVGADGKLKRIPNLEEALTAYGRGGCVWFDFTEPARQDLQPLTQPLGLHPVSLDDCFDEDQIPKIEDYPTNTFILFNRYRYLAGELVISEIDLFLGDRFLVSVGLRQTDNQRFSERLEEAINYDPNVNHQSADFLLHVILDYFVDDKLQVIEALQEEIDNTEEEILKDPSLFSPEMLLRLRRNMLNLRKSLFHEREILVRICRRDSPFFTEKAIYHFRDIYDHIAKFYEVTEMYREMISNLMELYFSIQNNKMTKAAHRTNQVVRRLTFITTIFMPLTLLAGIGGMSEWSMMTGPENWRASYTIFLAVMILLGAANYYLLRYFDSKDRDTEG